jgi:Mg/Co/Ni transporter MgtE
MPWPAMLCLATLVLLGFSSGMVNALAWFYVPVFFHGSQYLAICLSYYIKEKGLPEGMAASEVSSMLLKPKSLQYFATVVFVGAFLYVVIPHFCQSLGFDYALVAGVVLATVNFHHFNTDAAIWRLRDANCREILLA